ncbi:hypothetical protein LG634_35475, partial [Streptomyces bambusae]|uniref:hypothetical protein n=1 Tax=Streptomyces bambusae TaxID=1550616 RepID=UPI001D001000
SAGGTFSAVGEAFSAVVDDGWRAALTCAASSGLRGVGGRHCAERGVRRGGAVRQRRRAGPQPDPEGAAGDG